MTITLRQESQTGTTTKNDTLTHAELDNNFIDLLTTKILPLQVDADTGSVTVGQAQQNGVFTIQGGTGITTTVTEDSAGNANLTITKSVDEQGVIEIVGGSNIEATQPDSAGAVTLEVTNPAELNVDGAIVFTAKNTSGETIEKGEAVYISGISGNTTTIAKADANDTNKMPAFGLANEQITDTNTGEVITFGPITNLNTSFHQEGEELFVSTDPNDSAGGSLSSTPPTGESSFLQKIAKVTRSDQSAGSLFVMGAGRTNATPNLNDGNVFIGNAQNQISTTSLATYITDRSINEVSEDTTPQLGGNLDVNGNSIISGSNNDINITPDGTGNVVLDGLKYPNADGTSGQFLKTDGAGNLAFADVTAAGAIYHVNAGTGITVTQDDSAGEVTITNTGLQNLSDDSNPQLGGNLDLQNNKIVSTSAQDIKLEPDAAGDIYLESDTVFAGENNQQAHITSQGTGNLLLSTNNENSSGTIKINQGASGNIEIQPDGGGRIRFHNAYNMPSADGTNGQVMTTDGTGNISFTTISGGGGSIELEAGTGINITQPDSTGAFTIENNASVSDLSDTSISSVSDGQVLAYASGNWTNQNIDISSKSINDLSDVNTAGVSDGQVLTYSNANSRFEPQTPSSGGGFSVAVLNSSSHSLNVNSGTGTLNASWSEDYDPDSIVTTSSNQFTLSAGTYLLAMNSAGMLASVSASSGVNSSGGMLFTLRDTTNSTDIARYYQEGTQFYVNTTRFMEIAMGPVILKHRFTITVNTTYEIQYNNFTSQKQFNNYSSPGKAFRIEITKVAS